MGIPRNLSNLAPGANTTGVLGTSKGGTGLATVGTNGQVLQSNGTSLVYATPSAGAMTLISTQTASSSATLSWTGLSTYSQYMLIFQNLVPGTNSNSLRMQVGTGGGPAYLTSSYTFAGVFNDSYGSSPSSADAQNQASFYLSAFASITTGAVQGTSGQIIFSGCNSNYLTIQGQTSVANVSGASGAYNFTGFQSTSQTITAIRVFFNSGNIASGRASLYGISS